MRHPFIISVMVSFLIIFIFPDVTGYMWSVLPLSKEEIKNVTASPLEK